MSTQLKYSSLYCNQATSKKQQGKTGKERYRKAAGGQDGGKNKVDVERKQEAAKNKEADAASQEILGRGLTQEKDDDDGLVDSSSSKKKSKKKKTASQAASSRSAEQSGPFGCCLGSGTQARH